MVNAGRILIMPKGEWDTLVSYNMLDLVTYSGVAYLAKQASTGVNPKTDPNKDAYWQVFGTSVVPDNDTIIFDGNNNLAVNIDGTTIQYDSGTNFVKVAIDGVSLKYDSTNGYIYADVVSSLAGLSDVNLTNIRNGQIIAYNSASQKFVNIDLPVGGGSKIKVTTSETNLHGKTVTLSDGTHTMTGTFSNSGEYTFEGVEYTGNLVITSSDGTDTATRYLTVPYYSSYSVSLTFFEATVTVTYPEELGATCNISDGVTTIAATGSPMAFIVPNAGTWTATVTLDGADKTGSVTIGASGESKSITITFGTINVTYSDDFKGVSITCVNGGTTITKTAPTTGNTMVFYPPTTGQWTISGTVGGTPYSTTANVTSLSTPVPANLETIPDGSTATPTDDIQKWLACAGIKDKAYTTLSQVLGDSETFNALLGDSNACAYMKRSTTWALAEGLVPNMTSATTPSGTVISDSDYSGQDNWKAFDGNPSTNWNSNKYSSTGEYYCGYIFDTAQVVGVIKGKLAKSSNVGSVSNANMQYTLDGSTWNDIPNTAISFSTSTYDVELVTGITQAVKGIRLHGTSTVQYGTIAIYELQFYTDADITTSQYAMNLIGQYDTACDALLSDSTWASAIANSTYMKYILNVEVPTMTGYTTPEGQVVYSSVSSNPSRLPWNAFVDMGFCQFADFSITNQYVGYLFTSPVKVYVCENRGGGSANRSPKDTVYQGYDGTNWIDITEELNDLSVSSSTMVKHLVTKNLDTYQGYRYFIKNNGGASDDIDVYGKVNFYGRRSSSEKIHGGNPTYDSFYRIVDGNHVPVTDPSLLDAGTYTIYSNGLAKDPSDLSADYGKTVRICPNTKEIVIRPDKTLYWYGYACPTMGAIANSSTDLNRVAPSMTYNDTTCVATQASGSRGQIYFDMGNTLYSKVKIIFSASVTVSDEYDNVIVASISAKDGGANTGDYKMIVPARTTSVPQKVDSLDVTNVKEYVAIILQANDGVITFTLNSIIAE